jgi:Phosphotransferase enzyme family
MRGGAPPPRADRHVPPLEVVELAQRVLGRDGAPRIVAHERLARAVHRLRFEPQSGADSVVVKRLSARRARVCQLVAERWLPAVGLGWACPQVLGVLPEPGGAAVWHVYQCLAGRRLDCLGADPRQVRPVVQLIAELHGRFAGHALLAECRQHAEGLGMPFFVSHVGRCVRSLDSLTALEPQLSEPTAEVAERLLRRLRRLHGERHERAALLRARGGLDTLLHGDLWTTNTVVAEDGDGVKARLIDWDHTGVGPLTYDLSTFLYRFSPAERPWILGDYREAAARWGSSLPADEDLNLLFETAECARFACCLAEAALAACRGEGWGLEELAEIDTWFERLEPVLPEAWAG